MAIVRVLPGVDDQSLKALARDRGLDVRRQGNFAVFSEPAEPKCNCGGDCGRFCHDNNPPPSAA